MKKIYLVYPRAHKNTGSSQMRVFQLKDIIEKYGTSKFEILTKEVTNLRLNIAWLLWMQSIDKGSIIIFCKYAIDRVPNTILEKLKSTRNCIIAVDYIDRSLRFVEFKSIDIHIASCLSQLNYLSTFETEKNKIVLIPHQADIRLYEYTETNKSKEICYFGEKSNIYIPNKHISKISSIQYNGTVTDKSLSELAQYKYHYCIRPSQQNTDMNCFKPPTKIMNALAVKAIPIISIDQIDAVEILGDDFPFILRDYTENEFDRVFQKIKYDHDYYAESLKVIKSLNEVYSLQNFSMNFESIMSSAFNRKK